MDDKTLKKAVELADGWSLVHICDGEDWGQEFGDNSGVPTQQVLIQDPHKFQSSLDALAAQLTRQVDALGGDQWILEPYIGRTTITECDLYGMPKEEWHSRGPDRTANTIQAIIDSKVLDNG